MGAGRSFLRVSGGDPEVVYTTNAVESLNVTLRKTALTWFTMLWEERAKEDYDGVGPQHRAIY